MKTTCMLSLSFVFSAAVVAQADTSVVPISNLTFAHRTNLIDTDQSQTLETLSMADGFTRLPSSAYQTAGVYFITNKKGQVFGSVGTGGTGFEDTSKKKCEDLGYKLTSCTGGSPIDICPYNNSYFKSCCDASYKHNSSTVCPSPQILSTESCGGKYKCECPPSTFSFTTCGDFMITEETCADDSGSHYVCSCPTSVETPFDCKTYYAAPCGDVCKEAYEDTCHRYEGQGVKDTYGCEEYFDGCDKICKKAYTDNCHKYEDALDNCPNGATCSYYSDCSSKVQTFSCPKGFDKSDKACLFPMPVVYGDKTVTKEFLSGKTPIAVVFDEKNSNAIGLVEIKTDGKPVAQPQTWDSTDGVMTWASANCDIPELENCNYDDIWEDTIKNIDPENYAHCTPDGKENTAIILAKTTCKGTYYAAEACYKFEPTGCSDDFCRAKEWFLPSPYEWVVLYSNWSKMQATLKLLKNYGAMELQWTNPKDGKISDRFYHTSSEDEFNTNLNVMKSNIMMMGDSGFTPWVGKVTYKGYDTGTYSPPRGYRTRPAIRYGEKPKIETSLPILSILYGDGTVDNSIISDKTPIGIVFDAENHLAVALTNVREDGRVGKGILKWSTKYYDIPDIENCTEADFPSILTGIKPITITCGVDGRANTDAILSCGDACGETPAATACNLYQPDGCTEDFCKQGKWFLPSMRDLNSIYLQKAVIDATLSSLEKSSDVYVKISLLEVGGHWSSNEYNNDKAWYHSMRVEDGNEYYKSGSNIVVRPVIKYP